MAEKFILVSLEDEKAKKLATVLSNDTSRKILEYLGEKDASQDDIAKALDIPMSTVHYNMQNLIENKLVEVKDFYWSEKGNKVNVYTIAKKLIVISPKGATKRVGSSLKEIGILALTGIAATAIIGYFTGLFVRGIEAETALTRAVDVETSSAGAGIAQASLEAMADTPNLIFNLNPAYWFFAGVLFILVVYMLWSLLKNKKEAMAGS